MLNFRLLGEDTPVPIPYITAIDINGLLAIDSNGVQGVTT